MPVGHVFSGSECGPLGAAHNRLLINSVQRTNLRLNRSLAEEVTHRLGASQRRLAFRTPPPCISGMAFQQPVMTQRPLKPEIGRPSASHGKCRPWTDSAPASPKIFRARDTERSGAHSARSGAQFLEMRRPAALGCARKIRGPARRLAEDRTRAAIRPDLKNS